MKTPYAIAMRSSRAMAVCAGVVICPSGSFASSPLCKNISVFVHPKSNLQLSQPTPPEGRIAIVTDAGRDAVDAAAFCARRDRRAGWRKACERSTASGREMLLRTGTPGDSGVLVVTRVRSTTIIAHEAAGATGIRRSPRPLWADDSAKPRARRAARLRTL